MQQGTVDDLMGAQNPISPQAGSVDDLVADAKEKPTSNIKRIAQAAYTGFLDFGTNLAKISPLKYSPAGAIMSKFAPEGTDTYNEMIHSHYKDQVQEFQEGAQDSPISSNIARFAGSMAVPGGAAGKGVTALAGNVLPKMAARAAGGAAMGGMFGGIAADPNADPNKTFDPARAALGAGIGGAAGPIVGAIGDRYSNITKQLQGIKKDVKGFKGPILARDFKSDASKKAIDTVFDNTFMMTGRARNKSIEAVEPYVKMFLQKANQSSGKSSREKLGSMFRSAHKTMSKQHEEIWDNLYKNIDRTQGIKNFDLQPLKNSLNNILSENNLPKEVQKQMSNFLNNKNITFKDVHNVKRLLWNRAERLDKSNAITPDQEDLADLLRATYHDTNRMIEKGLRGNEDLYSQFVRANSFTSAYHETFNAKTQKLLMKGLDKADKLNQNMDKFINSLFKGNDKFQRQYTGLVGQKGANEAQNIILRDAFDSSYSGNGVFNVSGFLGKVSKMEETPFLNNETIKAMKGLQHIMKGATTAQATSKSPMGTLLKYGSTMGAGSGMVAQPLQTTAVLATARTLGAISTRSPLKNLLIMLDNAADKGNGRVIDYLTSKIENMLPKAGIIHKTIDNNVILDKEEKR
jgi:hypothetical protein